MRIDKDVAARFIKHAINSGPKPSAAQTASTSAEPTPQPTTSSDIGVTSRFSLLTDRVKRDSESEDEGLKVHMDAPSTDTSSRVPSPQPSAESQKKKKKSSQIKIDPLTG